MLGWSIIPVFLSFFLSEGKYLTSQKASFSSVERGRQFTARVESAKVKSKEPSRETSGKTSGKSLSSPPNGNGMIRFLHLSDVHVDYYYHGDFSKNPYPCNCRLTTPLTPDKIANCSNPYAANNSFGQSGCDASFSLFDSALDAMYAVNPNPDFILITGDIFAHYSTLPMDAKSERLRTTRMIADRLDLKFPDVAKHHAAFLALGNNDVYPDYFLNTSKWDPQVLLHQLALIWDDDFPEVARGTFEKGGYYIMPTVDPALQIIVLNTVVYSVSHKPDNTVDDPFGQFAWLAEELTKADLKKYKVIIIGHISPSMGSTVGPTTQVGHGSQWLNQYVLKYLKTIELFHHVIVAHIYGHDHRNGYRLVPTQVPTYAPTRAPTKPPTKAPTYPPTKPPPTPPPTKPSPPSPLAPTSIPPTPAPSKAGSMKRLARKLMNQVSVVDQLMQQVKGAKEDTSFVVAQPKEGGSIDGEKGAVMSILSRFRGFADSAKNRLVSLVSPSGDADSDNENEDTDTELNENNTENENVEDAQGSELSSEANNAKLYLSSSPAPIYLTSALSPIFDNDPAFAQWEYDPTTKEIWDLTLYHTKLAPANNHQASKLTWTKHFGVREYFQLPQELTLTDGLYTIPGKLSSNPELFQKYLDFKYGGAAYNCSGCMAWEVCAVKFMVQSECDHCIKYFKP